MIRLAQVLGRGGGEEQSPGGRVSVQPIRPGCFQPTLFKRDQQDLRQEPRNGAPGHLFKTRQGLQTPVQGEFS